MPPPHTHTHKKQAVPPTSASVRPARRREGQGLEDGGGGPRCSRADHLGLGHDGDGHRRLERRPEAARRLREEAHVAYLFNDPASTPELTLVQMAELVEQKFKVRINQETVHRAMDAHSFTPKKLHRDVVNRNSDINN
ncbi:hypothetical protein ON010_g5692 [Phytophthora cinnamomi]|nr:hypothetical protein ON010_g5692 [Phytophthora cinnamomi]